MEAQNDTSLTFIVVVLATSQFAFFAKQSVDRLLTDCSGSSVRISRLMSVTRSKTCVTDFVLALIIQM